MKNRVVILALVALWPLLPGCPRVGPDSIRRTQFDYNRAIIDTRNEQMLANLARLRFRDPPYFLEVSSVSTQYVWGGAAEAGVAANVIGSNQTQTTAGAGVVYEERPTVTYLPLQGDEFVDRLLSPVPMEAVVLLANSGWRIDRLMRCCVQRVNDLWNAPTASGPTPDAAPEFEAFVEMSGLLDRLLSSRALDVRFRPVGADRGGFELTLAVRDARGREAELRRLRQLLGLDDDAVEFRLTPNPTLRAADEIGILPRSVIGTMNYLSQSVEVPARDVEAGRVTVTRRPDGTVFDWNELTGGLFRVRASLEPPEGAFIRVQYRDAWFWIDDADLSSKSTFNLLGQLFQLQAGQSGGAAPLLTLPVGR